MFPSLVSASSDVSVWQGQYYTGTTFNTGTYDFNFTVYDAPTGGNSCYTNTTALTTGSFGEWKTEQSGVNSACNNVSKDYYLNININGADQTPRRILVVWNSLRKNVDELTMGKLQTASQVIAPVIQADTQIIAPVVNATQVIANNITASYFMGDGSLLTNLPAAGAESDPLWTANQSNYYVKSEVYNKAESDGKYLTSESEPLWAGNYSLVAFLTDLGNYYDKTESDSRYLKTSGPQTLDGNLNVNGDVTFVGSYTNLTVQTVTTNGSIVPGYDSMFDIGSPSFQFNNIYGNLNASYVQNAPWLTSYDETDPMWAANSSTVARTGNCPAGQVVQNTTTGGVQCMTLGSGGLAPVYLGSKLTATNAAYTTIFIITLTPSKMNVIQAYLAQSSSTNGVAIRNRVIVNASGPVGNCHFVTQTGSTAQAINNIAVSNSSANTGESTMSLGVNVPFINTVTCTVLADANEKNLVIQFESENANNVTTYAGSYYTNAVN